MSSLSVTQSSPSALALGCVTFGREIDRAAAFGMMDYGAAQGITLFDTAAAYGGGSSEAIVGEWLKANSESSFSSAYTIATKLLPPYSSAGLEQALTTSLGRLQRPYVDLLFLHRWDESILRPGVLATLDSIVRSGRARSLGASNFDCTQLKRALAAQDAAALTPFTALQNAHNFAVRAIDAETRALCAARKISTISYSPLGAGFLTGKYETGVPGGTRFAIIPGHQDIYFTPQSRARLARLQGVAQRTGHTMTELALAWALRQPQIDTVLIGGRTPAQIAAAVQARSLEISSILAELDIE